MKKAWVLSYPLSAQRRLWSDWTDAQADLSLRWAHSHFVGFVMSRLYSLASVVPPSSIVYILKKEYRPDLPASEFTPLCPRLPRKYLYDHVPNIQEIWSTKLFIISFDSGIISIISLLNDFQVKTDDWPQKPTWLRNMTAYGPNDAGAKLMGDWMILTKRKLLAVTTPSNLRESTLLQDTHSV